MVEYALVLVLVVSGVSIALGDLSTTSATAVEERGDRIGNPQAYTNAVDPGGVTGGIVGTDLEPPAELSNAVHLEAILNRRSTEYEPKWQASADIQVLTADSLPAAAATLEGHWTIIKDNGLTKIYSVNCETDALGECTMTIDALKLGSDIKAWFVYDSLVVDPAIYTWDSADDTTDHGTPATVLICRPGRVLNAAEDDCE